MPDLSILKMAVAMSVAGVLVAGSASAEASVDKATRDALRSACRADFSRLCSNTMPGGGRGLACLKEHAADLSSDCRNALVKAGKLTPPAK
jgi:hypothetical protein